LSLDQRQNNQKREDTLLPLDRNYLAWLSCRGYRHLSGFGAAKNPRNPQLQAQHFRRTLGKFPETDLSERGV